MTPGLAASDTGRTGAQSHRVATPGSSSERALAAFKRYPVFWMALLPCLLGAAAIGSAAVMAPRPQPNRAPIAVHDEPATSPRMAAPAAPAVTLPNLSEIEAKNPMALSSDELLVLADAELQQRKQKALALGAELEHSPDLLTDKAKQGELVRIASDPQTAREGLASLAKVRTPLALDLIYEVWTQTKDRSQTTELARRLLYTTDVRAKASPALAVALDLRAASTCDDYRVVLPRALTDGDRRSLLPLAKLVSRRGCGPNKGADCFACLRGSGDELAATINAVKSRRPPSFTTSP